ncbi:MAG TPA: GDP-mannose 4,6-dehydratase [Thermomicrobiales bacterium]|nr:GDP-mannose 4,6-dehydratase [Thermomicrobiales bacterium]
MRVALITGVSGQDGWHLARLLLAEGTTVWGATRDGRAPAALPGIRPVAIADIRDGAAIERALAQVRPDELYHLAALSRVDAAWADPALAGEVNGIATARLLEAMRRISPRTRLYVASSALAFGAVERSPQDESTPFRSDTPYGLSKAYASEIARIYRRAHGLFVAVGIHYNHESPRRPPSFLSRKIACGAVAIARGEATALRLGNLDAIRDWSFAGDHAQAMILATRADEPDDFVFGSGDAHAVRDWCARAFGRAGLDWRDHVVSDPELWRPAEAVPLVADPTEARRRLGLEPSLGFEALVDLMVAAERAVDAAEAGR